MQRKQTIVSKKMDTILAAKLEADRKYEAQRKELEALHKQMASNQQNKVKKAQLDGQQQKMRREMDQAVATFSTEMTKLKSENDSVK